MVERFFKEIVCGGPNAAGGGCGAPRRVVEISQASFEESRGAKRSGAWFEHNEDEAPEVSGPFRVVLGLSPCSDCREY